MIEIQVVEEIDRPAATVFGYLADMSNNPRWQKGMQTCRWTSDPPLRLGSTYDQVARFLGREIVSSFEVVELEPDRRIRIRTTSGTMPIDVTRDVVPLADDRCMVRATVRGDPSRVFRLASPLMKWMVRRSVTGDYRRLKEMLEG